VKIERERDEEFERWSFEVDGWIDRSLIVLLLIALGGGAGAEHLLHQVGLLPLG
jgi:hypothetical protein